MEDIRKNVGVSKKWKDGVSKLMGIVNTHLKPDDQVEVERIVVNLARTKILVEVDNDKNKGMEEEIKKLVYYVPGKGLQLNGTRNSLRRGRKRNRDGIHSKNSSYSDNSGVESSDGGESNESSSEDDGESSDDEDGSSRDSRGSNHNEDSVDEDVRDEKNHSRGVQKKHAKTSTLYTFDTNKTVKGTNYDFVSVESALQSCKCEDVHVGDRVGLKMSKFQFKKGDEKGDYEGEFFGTVREVMYNIDKSPFIVEVERDNGNLETYKTIPTANDDKKMMEFIDQRKTYISGGWKQDVVRTKNAVEKITNMVETANETCSVYDIDTQVFVKEGNDRVVRETASTRTSYFGPTMVSLAEAIKKSNGYDNNKHSNLIIDLILTGLLSSSMDNIITVLFNPLKGIKNINECPKNILQHYQQCCYERKLNPAGGNNTRFQPLRGKKECEQNVFSLASEHISDYRCSISRLQTDLANMKERYSNELEVKKIFMTESGQATYTGKIISYNEGTYKIQFNHENFEKGSFVCNMTSGEVKASLTKKLEYTALDRRAFAQHAEILMKNVHGVSTFRSNLAIQLIGVCNYDENYSERTMQQIQYERVSLDTAPGIQALKLGVSPHRLYETVSKVTGIAQEEVANQVCETTRGNKKIDIFPLGAKLVHITNNGYTFGKLVKEGHEETSTNETSDQEWFTNKRVEVAGDATDIAIHALMNLVKEQNSTGIQGNNDEVLVVENMDVGFMYHAFVDDGVRSNEKFLVVAKNIVAAFVDAYLLLQPTLKQSSTHQSGSNTFHNLDAIIGGSNSGKSHKKIQVKSITSSSEFDLDFSILASGQMFPFASAATKLALAAKVLEGFILTAEDMECKKNKKLKSGLALWLADSESESIQSWITGRPTALDFVSLAKENKSKDVSVYIKAVGHIIMLRAKENADVDEVWQLAEKELLKEMNIEIGEDFQHSPFCKKNSSESTCAVGYCRTIRKGLLDQLCSVDETGCLQVLLSCRSDKNLRQMVKVEHESYNVPSNSILMQSHPSTLIVPRGKEKSQKCTAGFLNCLKTLSGPLMQKHGLQYTVMPSTFM